MSGGIAPLIPNPRLLEIGGCFTTGKKNFLYLLCMRLHQPQRRSGHFGKEKISCHTEIFVKRGIFLNL